MPGGRPKKPAPRRSWGRWSVSFVASRQRWRIRPPPSVDPKRRERFFLTEQAALDYVAAQVARLAEPEPAATWTLGDWAGHWLATTCVTAGWSERTLAIYTDHLWYFSTLHGKELPDLQATHLRARVAHLLTVGAERRPESTSKRDVAPLAPSSVKEAVATLERCLEAARDDEIIRSNPARKVTTPRVVRQEPVLWTAEERVKLASAISRDDLEALWRLLIEAGLRIGEVLGLDWPDFDRERRAVHIHRTVFKNGRVQEWPKSRRPRTVLLTPTSWAALIRHHDAQRPGCRWIFEAPEGWQAIRRATTEAHVPMSYDGVRYRLQRLCERASVPYHPTHTGRHGVASYLIQLGADPAAVAEQLGHANAGVTLRIYSHASQESRERVRDALAEILQPPTPGDADEP